MSYLNWVKAMRGENIGARVSVYEVGTRVEIDLNCPLTEARYYTQSSGRTGVIRRLFEDEVDEERMLTDIEYYLYEVVWENGQRNSYTHLDLIETAVPV